MTKLDTLIKQIINRNSEIQTKKNVGPYGWVTAIIFALINFISIGVVLWLSSRRAKELAGIHTQLERAKLEQAHQAYRARNLRISTKRKELLDELKCVEVFIQKQDGLLKDAEKIYEAQKEKIAKLRTWKEINDI
ncbi:MAG: hypothetical protein PVI90_03120 [Desulfobacteraceae bacterium]|jgi:hypothetical protein